MKRRFFLAAAPLLVAAPSIVRAASLMPVKPLPDVLSLRLEAIPGWDLQMNGWIESMTYYRRTSGPYFDADGILRLTA